MNGPGGILVNIARGLVVDEGLLCAALEAGVIAGAGLDAYEPDVPERQRALPNVVPTPHIAALTGLAQDTRQRMLLDTLEAFFAGRAVRWQVPAG